MRNNSFILILIASINSFVYSQQKGVVNSAIIDTSKWSPTDSIYIDLNNDNIKDLIVEFDKYKALTRPSNIQTPILFYIGDKNGNFNFLTKGERMINYPNFKLLNSGNDLLITQEGSGKDRYMYSNYYSWFKNDIILNREIVEQKIERLNIDKKTGNILKIVVRVDTIEDKKNNIPISKFIFKSKIY